MATDGRRLPLTAVLITCKASGAFFVPTVGLAAHLAQSGHLHAGDHIHVAAHGHHHAGRAVSEPLGYLLAPWGAGHLVLYLIAAAASSVRQAVRLALMPDWKAQLLGGAGGKGEAALKEAFARFDTSGDGYLDATELKLALRFVTGEDVSVEDCERIIRGVDTDGDGVIDFHEWKMALAER